MENKIREMYVIDTFIDYEGNEKHFILAGITITPEDKEIPKALSIGIAVCDPKDSFDEEIGKKISKGRALKAIEKQDYTHVIASYDYGILNHNVVSTILKQEVEFLKDHPERYIESYNNDKQKYLRKKACTEEYSKLDKASKNVIDYLRHCSDDLKDDIYRLTEEEF